MIFRALQLEDKATINSILLPLKRNDSALGFANLYSLTEKYHTEICIEDGVIFVRQLHRIPDAVAYYPPLGTRDMAADLHKIMAQAAEEQRDLVFVGFSQDDCAMVEAALPGEIHFTSDRNFADYIYHTDVIAEYRGPALAKKRREVNKFFSLYGEGVEIETIDASHIEELRTYQNEWFTTSRLHGTEEHHPELEHRKIMLDLNYFEELELQGILLRINGKVEGYAYGCVLPGGAFDVMVLKGNLSYRYIWRTILRELAQFCLDKAELLNLEEDIGLPGLRENKMCFQTIELMEKFQSQRISY